MHVVSRCICRYVPASVLHHANSTIQPRAVYLPIHPAHPARLPAAPALQAQIDNAGGERLRAAKRQVAKLSKDIEALEAGVAKKGVQAKAAAKQLDKLRKEAGKQASSEAWFLIARVCFRRSIAVSCAEAWSAASELDKRRKEAGKQASAGSSWVAAVSSGCCLSVSAYTLHDRQYLACSCRRYPFRCRPSLTSWLQASRHRARRRPAWRPRSPPATPR